MNLDETKKCLAMIQETYPRFMDGRTMKATSDIWVRLFDEPYAVVEAAVMAYLTSDNKGFAPSPGQIKEKIAQMNDTEPDEMQAWAIVYKALARSDREAYANLPPLVQSCIGSYHTFYEWGQEDIGTLNTVTKAGFMRTYRARAQKQREYGKLPDFAKGAFPAIEAPKQYTLPTLRAKDEYGEPTAIPEAAMQKLNAFKALAQNDDLKRAAKIGKRVDGLNTAIDSLGRKEA